MANDSRGGRLISDLNSVFRRDPEIDEYDFLPVKEPQHNKSPLTLQEHKLGIEAWSVKILFQYAYNRLINWRNNQVQTKFLDPVELQHLTRAVVLINPECTTVWNIRKELVDSDQLLVSDDLKLGALVLTKHPKSPETFSHRKWLLNRFIESCLSSSAGSNNSTGSNVYEEFVHMDAIDLNLETGTNHAAAENRQGLHIPAMQSTFQEHMQRELAICRCAAERYHCNYNAWSHRIWVMQFCFNCTVQVLLSELQCTECWVRKHVSDHSGFHYRQFLLNVIQQGADCLIEQFSLNYKNLLQKEMHLITDLINSFPGHETLWYHRRYVFHALCETCDSASVHESLPSRDEEVRSNTQKRTKFENERQMLLLKEVDLITKQDLSNKDQWHQSISQKYLDWIQKCCREST